MSEGDWKSIRGFLVKHHVLWDAEGVYLVDSGFIGGEAEIEHRMRVLGRSMSDIQALVLTHGHLDHILNANALKEKTGCRVFAPKKDRRYLAGFQRYQGWYRLTGWAEALGKVVLNHSSTADPVENLRAMRSLGNAL